MSINCFTSFCWMPVCRCLCKMSFIVPGSAQSYTVDTPTTIISDIPGRNNICHQTAKHGLFLHISPFNLFIRSLIYIYICRQCLQGFCKLNSACSFHLSPVISVCIRCYPLSLICVREKHTPSQYSPQKHQQHIINLCSLIDLRL